jgi:catechol 2,3-dioxygenase-like lactoylglutathione lyase family enzyme
MKLRLLVLCLALPASALGQPTATAASDAAVIKVAGAAFALSVADIEASAKWYTEKLGLRVIMRAPRTDATRASAIVLQGGGLTVELVQHDDAVPLRTVRPGDRGAISIHGIFKVGVTVDDFNKTLATLRARGVDIAYGPYPKRPDQPANVIIRDNAGNFIQIFGK